MLAPANYDAWYKTPRGSWIGSTESNLLLNTLQPKSGSTLLDVGCGTGYFSESFTNLSLDVVGLDNDTNNLLFAKNKRPSINYIKGSAEQLPFVDYSFDYVSAITSLCFVKEFHRALAEMWRVSRVGVVLGLLNMSSLLYRQKYESGNYKGARWDSSQQVLAWLQELNPEPIDYKLRSAIFSPFGGIFSQTLEKILPNRLLLGGFLVVCILKNPELK